MVWQLARDSKSANKRHVLLRGRFKPGTRPEASFDLFRLQQPRRIVYSFVYSNLILYTYLTSTMDLSAMFIDELIAFLSSKGISKEICGQLEGSNLVSINSTLFNCFTDTLVFTIPDQFLVLF
jgi:hypothetical protein